MNNKIPLSVERIVEEALVQVDAEGLQALSMRRLGAALGVRAMALYRHVESKEALLDALQARIVCELPPMPPARDWEDGVRERARSFRRLLAAHPRAIPLFTRPASTDGAFDAMVDVVRLLQAAGLDELRSLLAFQALLAFVVGQALWQYGPDGERGSDDEFDFGLKLMLAGLRAELETPGGQRD